MKKDKPRVSLRSIATNINKDWILEDWIQWPPDAFALCSIIINRTGLYKYFLLDTNWWHTSSWAKDIDRLSDIWIRVVSNRLLDNSYEIAFLENELLSKHYQVLKNEWKRPSIEIDHLRVLGNIFDLNREGDREFIQAILYFAAVADVTCGGLGFLGQQLTEKQLSHRIFMGVANLLLNNTGTLSTISKHHGVVLPKMRTPQAGMTVRSITHHLTFHTTEVEVIWRTFPLLCKETDDLNILAVPYPFEVDDNDLTPRPDDGQAVRFFEPKIDEKIPNYDIILRMVDWIGTSAKQGEDIDIIVLPEMALTYNEYALLLEEFEIEFLKKKRCKRLPIVVTGVTKKNTNNYGIPGVDETFQNEARIAVFFANEWYTTTQRKHHRWQLDNSQIKQYEFEKIFPGNKLWFEYCSASQRRMTIMAPNDRLAFTALICEDLAQQEPVSEVIRGVGPSLLLALLSDGPQLQNRWAARYAGVLASDPGTAVLSLTSLGMAQRSKNAKNPEDKPSLQVGLWKDLDRGFKDLVLADKEKEALLFTINPANKEEYTLDGRSDGKVASYLHWSENDKNVSQISFSRKSFEKKDNPLKRADLEGSFESLRELSAIQFVIDAIIEILMDQSLSSTLKNSALELFLGLLNGANRFKSPRRKFRGQIFRNMKDAWDNPHLLGISASAASSWQKKMKAVTEDLRKVISITNGVSTMDISTLFGKIINLCQRELRLRTQIDGGQRTYMSVLYNLNNRLACKAADGRYKISQLGVTKRKSIALQNKINKIVEQIIFRN